MRNRIIGGLLILCCGAFFVSGCAKREMVKGEESSIAKPIETSILEPTVKETLSREEPAKTQSTLNVKEKKSEDQVLTVDKPFLEKIYFDFDSYLLGSDARDTLSKNAEYLMKNTTVKILIEGHCDEHGSVEYNLALGERRAKAAFNYLETMGVSSARLSVISYGKEIPLNDGHDEASWAQNRRDEFVIIK